MIAVEREAAAVVPSPRATALACVLVLVPVAVALVLFAVQGRIAGLGVDDAFYLLMADRYFGRLAGEPDLVALLATRTYPPLYPLLLGAFGGGSDGLLAAHLVNALMILAWVAAWLAFLLRSGVPAAAAVALTLGAAFAPFTLYHAQVLWSEHLYLALQMLALALLAVRPAHARVVLLAGAATGLALLSRTMGIALVAALACWLVWHRPRRWPVALALAALPVLERFTHGASVYGNELQGWTALGLYDVVDRLAQNANGLWMGWRHGLSMAEVPVLAGPVLLLVLAAIGWVLRVRRGTLDALLVPAYVTTAWLWGFSEHATRFLYPLWPIALFHAWVAASRMVEGVSALRRTHSRQWIAALLAAVAVVPGMLEVSARMRIPIDPELADYKRIQKWLVVQPAELAPDIARMIDTSIADNRRIRALTPAGACIHSDTPGLTMVYAHRVPFRAPWRSLDELTAMRGLPCRFAYIDPTAVAGAQDARALDAAGVRVLHRSRIDGPGEPRESGLLLELPVR